MKITSKNLVFFGSGPVAARSLSLLAENFQIESVVTKPRPAHHKGPVPVLEVAETLGLKIYEVVNKSELDEVIDSSPFKSSLGVLIDFGIIVSQKVIDYFELGIINSHFSILPEWRGADPITFSLLSGQETTGVSLMLLVAAMDEGPLLAYGELEITPNTTEISLTEELIQLSDALLIDTIPRYQAGQAEPVPQTVTGRAASYSRKITKADGNIDWQKPAEQIEREIRAFINWPKSRTTLGDVEVIITKAQAMYDKPSHTEPGTFIISDDKDSLFVATSKGFLKIESLKPSGKPEMPIKAFLAGYSGKLKS